MLCVGFYYQSTHGVHLFWRLVIVDIETLTKFLYYLINFLGNDESLFMPFALPFIPLNTFIVRLPCSIAWSGGTVVNGTDVLLMKNSHS